MNIYELSELIVTVPHHLNCMNSLKYSVHITTLYLQRRPSGDKFVRPSSYPNNEKQDKT